MKVDLTKPMTRIYHGLANYIRDTPDGKRIVEWQASNGEWVAAAYTDENADDLFKNIPPEPRKVTVAVVWSGLGSNTTPCTVLLDDVEPLRRMGCHITEHEIEEPTP